MGSFENKQEGRNNVKLGEASDETNPRGQEQKTGPVGEEVAHRKGSTSDGVAGRINEILRKAYAKNLNKTSDKTSRTEKKESRDAFEERARNDDYMYIEVMGGRAATAFKYADEANWNKNAKTAERELSALGFDVIVFSGELRRNMNGITEESTEGTTMRGVGSVTIFISANLDIDGLETAFHEALHAAKRGLQTAKYYNALSAAIADGVNVDSEAFENFVSAIADAYSYAVREVSLKRFSEEVIEEFYAWYIGKSYATDGGVMRIYMDEFSNVDAVKTNLDTIFSKMEGESNPHERKTITSQKTKHNYGENGMKAFNSLAEENPDMDHSELVARFDAPYQAGLTGVERRRIELLNDFQVDAYEAGRLDYFVAQAKDAQHKPSTILSEKDSGVDFTGAPKDITPTQREFGNWFLGGMGVKGRFSGDPGTVDGSPYNGYYDSSSPTGDVVFAPDFGISPELMEKLGSTDFKEKVERLSSQRENSFIFYVGHEVAGHVAMDRAPAAMRVFVNDMYNYLQNKNPNGNLARTKMKYYNSKGSLIDTSGAFAEIGFDSILMLYDNEQDFMSSMHRIWDNLSEEGKEGARTYLTALKEFIEKIKAWVRNLTGKENKQVRENAESAIKTLEQLRDEFEQAIGESFRVVKQARENTETTSTTETAQKNTGLTDGVKMSAKENRQGNNPFRTVFAKLGLDKLSEKLGDLFPLSANFETAISKDNTSLSNITISAHSTNRNTSESYYSATRRAIRENFPKGTKIAIEQVGVDAGINLKFADESISKASTGTEKQIILDIIPYVKDLLPHSRLLAVEKVRHTDNKKTSLFCYRLYNAYNRIETDVSNNIVKRQHAVVFTVVQNLDAADAYLVTDIRSIAPDSGHTANNSRSTRIQSNAPVVTIAELYKIVKKIPRKDGGLLYSDSQKREYLFDYSETNDGKKYSLKADEVKQGAKLNPVGESFREDKYFARQIDKWGELADGVRVKVGAVLEGSALNRVGIPASGMYFDVGKIRKSMKEHNDHLTPSVLKGIPDLLNNPIVIAEYTGSGGNIKNTVNVYGNLFVRNTPVVVGIVMNLDASGNNLISNVRTIHARSNFAKQITDDTVLYLNEDKKRTRKWFQDCGNLNVPLAGTRFGLIRSIAYEKDSVKHNQQETDAPNRLGISSTNTKAKQNADTNSTQNLEIETNEGYNRSVKRLPKWHTDLSKTQIKEVEKWLRQAGNPEHTRITDTVNWYKGRIDGKDLFVIYSTEAPDNPTILYEVKGENAILERDILLDLLEDEENGKSVDGKPSFAQRVSEGSWMQNVNDSKNNFRDLGRGRNNQNVGVLPGQSQRNGSRAFRSVVENIFGKAEREGNSLKDSDNVKSKDNSSAMQTEFHSDQAETTSTNETAEKNADHTDGVEYTMQDGIKYSAKMSFEKQVDAALSYDLEKDADIFVMYTPESLQALGFAEYPVLITQKHVRDAVQPKSKNNKKHHGLKVEMLKNLPEILSEPVMFLRSLTDVSSIVVVSQYTDGDNLPIIAVVTPNGSGKYGRVEVVSNFALSVYGRTGFPSFINRTIKANGVLYVNKNRTRKLFARSGHKMPQALNKNGFYEDNITQYLEVVKNNSKDGLLSQQDNSSANSRKSGSKDIRYSMKDSDGNALTKAQAEYFKDSKVRDKDGNLKVMYHGTSNGGFTVFDTYASNFGLFGQGSYFTDNRSVAESYQAKGKGTNPGLYKVYLNITNPLDMDGDANIAMWKKAFLNYDLDESYLDGVTSNEEAFKALKENLADAMYTRNEAIETVTDLILSMKYDGITHIGGGRFNKKDDTRHRVFIVFESEQIKDTNNLNPTESYDINFSLKADKDLQRKYERLLEINQSLREQFKITKFAKADKKALDAFTKKLLKDNFNDQDTDIKDAIAELFEYMANGEDGQPPVLSIFKLSNDVVKIYPLN